MPLTHPSPAFVPVPPSHSAPQMWDRVVETISMADSKATLEQDRVGILQVGGGGGACGWAVDTLDHGGGEGREPVLGSRTGWASCRWVVVGVGHTVLECMAGGTSSEGPDK